MKTARGDRTWLVGPTALHGSHDSIRSVKQVNFRRRNPGLTWSPGLRGVGSAHVTT